jgi:hypothetical protein
MGSSVQYDHPLTQPPSLQEGRVYRNPALSNNNASRHAPAVIVPAQLQTCPLCSVFNYRGAIIGTGGILPVSTRAQSTFCLPAHVGGMHASVMLMHAICTLQ